MTQILRVAVPAPVDCVFDYLPPDSADPEALRPGLRIEVPFGRTRKIGILLDIVDSPAIKSDRLRQALSVLDTEPLLGSTDLKLLAWASRYYQHPIGESMAAALTVLLRRGGAAEKDPDQRRLHLTMLSQKSEHVTTQRAPRQLELLRLIRDAPDGLSSDALSTLGWNARSAVRAVIAKGWAEWREEPVSPKAREMAALAGPVLTPHQAAALTEILDALGGYRSFLLDGVTGSGKTEVYLRASHEAVSRGLQVMILLPEINLTPQLEARFRARLAVPIVVFHSGLGAGERRRAWLAMQRGDAAILLGTRSAVFTPMKDPGLIILDEEHDVSFKQQDGFRFSARDVAVMRASLARIPVVLGSATPSLESLHNAEQGRYRRLSLPDRTGLARLPSYQLLDIRGLTLRGGISTRLTTAIRETLLRGEQALLFVNRRGYAPTLICHACGFVAECRHCDSNLVVHAVEERLRCHHCGHEQALLRACPACGSSALRPLGLGTERVESSLAEEFPGYRLARFDRDSIRSKTRLERTLCEVSEGRVDLLIGTQMLAKGHHFPGVTLVGVLDVDAGLYSLDFRAEERTAQMIIQVAGRAGREERPGRVIVQTRRPDHPMLQILIREGYGAFARAALGERREMGLPPFSHQALWRAEGTDTRSVENYLCRVARLARNLPLPGLRVLGPAPAPLTRRSGRYRWQLLLRADRRAQLQDALTRLRSDVAKLDEARKVRWSIDVDPADLF